VTLKFKVFQGLFKDLSMTTTHILKDTPVHAATILLFLFLSK